MGVKTLELPLMSGESHDPLLRLEMKVPMPATIAAVDEPSSSRPCCFAREPPGMNARQVRTRPNDTLPPFQCSVLQAVDLAEIAAGIDMTAYLLNLELLPRRLSMRSVLALSTLLLASPPLLLVQT